MMGSALVVGSVSMVLLAFLGMWVMGRPRIRRLKNKHVFITGGSIGIGFEIAREALLQQSSVTIVARSQDKLTKAVEDLRRLTNCSSDCIRYEVADVGCYDQVLRAVETANEWKAIDVVVCNAGVSRCDYLENMSIADMNMIVQTNLCGTLNTLHAALPLLKESLSKKPRDTKAVMIVASLSAMFNVLAHSVYTATKYAQRGLAEALRLELMPYNISVGVSCPGFTDTPMLQDTLAKIPADILGLAKFFNLFDSGRVESPRDVAKYTLDAIKEGRFIAAPFYPGFLLKTFSRGVFPSDSFVSAISELLLFIPLRLCSFVFAGVAPFAFRLLSSRYNSRSKSE